jgi:uroporphyrinogen III methyltransferase/synthase
MTFTVLVTRPAHQSQPLVEGIRARGWNAVSLPLFDIRPVADTEASAERLKALRDADWWIFTSSNAVERAHQLCAEGWPKTAAVGSATAAALTKIGVAVTAVPTEDHTSEALLELPEFNAVENRNVVIVAGDDGRQTLELNLRDRGARVERVDVYRREPIQHEAGEVGRALLAADCLLLTSGSAIERIKSIVPGAQRERLLAMPAVVPSQRVADLAREGGFSGRIEIAKPMSDAAVIKALDGLAAAHVEAAPEPPRKPAKVTKPAPAPIPAPPARGGRGALLLAWFTLVILLALIGAGAWGGWQVWQQMEAERSAAERNQTQTNEVISELQRRVERLSRDKDDIQQTARRNNAEIGLLRERQDEVADAMSRLTDSVSGGRIDLQLAAVEQLLVNANERLLVARDVQSADRALELADRRLSRLAEPRLFAVREAIAEDRARLSEVPVADHTALALTVSTLISRADRLALSARVPDRHAAVPSEADEAASDDEVGGLRRLLRATRLALDSVFTVRRSDVAVQPLLAPEQASLVRTVLMLRLESARAALLARDGTAFREALDAADEWLLAQFDVDDAAVAGARREIARMQRSDLSPALPDISTSLGLLRGVIDAPRDGQP